MKFGQLIGCNMRNIFLEKSYTKFDGETSPRPFSKKLKLSISLDQKSKALYSFFIVCYVEGYWNIENKLFITFFYLALTFLKK